MMVHVYGSIPDLWVAPQDLYQYLTGPRDAYPVKKWQIMGTGHPKPKFSMSMFCVLSQYYQQIKKKKGIIWK